MNHLLPRPRCGAALLLAAATAAGCATTKPTPSPQEEYRQAVAQAHKGHYVEAQRLFEEVRDADTPVRLELLAEVGVADALYKGGKFEEAAQAYSKLLAVHSGDPIADYLNYQLGMCFYRRIDTVDRDQGLTRKARSQFMALITRYPESDLVPAAREKLQACNDYLARRELYVGRFYLQRGNYEAAKRRFVRGLVRYGKVTVVPELLHDLCLAADGLGDAKAAQQAADRLRDNFPASATTASLANDRARARAKREGGTGDGPLHRLGQWWSGHHTEDGGEATERATPEAAPPEASAPAATAAPPESAPAPTPPATTGDGGAAAEPAHPAQVSALDPEAPWPGATVATNPTRTPARPAEATPEGAPPSRWHHLLSWLHRRDDTPSQAADTTTAAPASTAAPGLIIRHIPPVGEEVRETATATRSTAPAAAARVPTVPASVTPPPVVSQVAAVEVEPPGPVPVAPPPARSPEPVATTPPSPPAVVVATPPATVAPAPLTRALTGRQGGGDLVVEEFPAVDDGAAPAAASSTAAPARPKKESLADRVDEILGQEEAPHPAVPVAAPIDALPATRLPAAAPPTPQSLVANGQALRHDLPRPLPQPTFTHPTPPLGGESLPAMITGGDGAVEWHTMTPPAVVQEQAREPAPAAAPPVEAAQPPLAGPTDGQGAFWSGVRERFTGTTAAAE